jgi:hypothetical protein
VRAQASAPKRNEAPVAGAKGRVLEPRHFLIFASCSACTQLFHQVLIGRMVDAHSWGSTTGVALQ